MQLLLQWESNNRVCVCSTKISSMQCACAILSSAACPPQHYFSTLSHKRRFFFKKNFIEHKMCVSTFSTIFVWNIFHSRKYWARYDQKCSLFFINSTRYSCPILMKLEFSRQVFEKYSNIRFHKNPSSGSRVVPCGQMGRHEEALCCFSQFCERTNKMEVYKDVVARKV